MTLTEIIIERIKSEGPIPFSTFMEMALYYPGIGYYTTGTERIGKCGDYFTAPTITNLLGISLGRQLEEMWHTLGEEPFTIVEYGAGTGALCKDILEYLKNNARLYCDLKYIVVEKSPAMQLKEKMVLPEKVSWCNAISENITSGCILSNELVDNLPVHQVVMEDDLMEVFVDYRDAFIEILKPASNDMKAYLRELHIELPKGYRTEINLQSIDWLTEITTVLKKGFVLTIDYGFTTPELYRAKHRDGTIVCYNKHRVSPNPYSNVGEQDITAHVNFSALHHWGMKKGLSCCGYTDQVNFLRALGLNDYIRKMEHEGQALHLSEQQKLSWLHTLLVDMGSKYKVLVQQTGLEKAKLSGLIFSQSSC